LKTYADNMVGPQSGGLAKAVVFKDEEVVWSPCGEQGMLNINFSVSLSDSAALAEEVENSEKLGAKDASVSVYGFGGDLVWRVSQC
jgi:hypothetical protein